MTAFRDTLSEADFPDAERWPTWICRVCRRECDYYLTANICDRCGARMEEERDEHQRRISEHVSQSD